MHFANIVDCKNPPPSSPTVCGFISIPECRRPIVVVVLSELVDIYIETDDDYTPDSIPDVLTTFECFNTGLQSPPLTTDRKGVDALRVDRHSCNFSDAIACKCTGS